MSDVTFNIYGGNNQILPNATKAEQNFYGDQFAEKTLAKDGEAPQPLTEEEQALSIYINKVESLRGYITLLRSCKTARDLGEVVATMRQQEPSLTDELIVKQSFISLLLPFVPKWEKGQSVDNIRGQSILPGRPAKRLSVKQVAKTPPKKYLKIHGQVS